MKLYYFILVCHIRRLMVMNSSFSESQKNLFCSGYTRQSVKTGDKGSGTEERLYNLI